MQCIPLLKTKEKFNFKVFNKLLPWFTVQMLDTYFNVLMFTIINPLSV